MAVTRLKATRGDTDPQACLKVQLVAGSEEVHRCVAEVLASASDLTLLPGTVSGLKADVVLLYMEDGFDVSLLDASLSTPTVLLVESVTQDEALEAVAAGVFGVIKLSASPEQYVAAIRSAAAGLISLPPDAFSFSPPIGHRTAPVLEELTPREREVLRLLADGASNKEIAQGLGISDHTVKFHLTSVFGKLGVSSRTEAVTVGIQSGLILL